MGRHISLNTLRRRKKIKEPMLLRRAGKQSKMILEDSPLARDHLDQLLQRKKSNQTSTKTQRRRSDATERKVVLKLKFNLFLTLYLINSFTTMVYQRSSRFSGVAQLVS